MKRKDIQKYIDREEKIPRYLAMVVSPWQQETGIEAPKNYAFKDFLSVYGEGALANVWVFRAVRAISEAQAQLPLLLQAKNRKGEWETIQTGSLFKLFEDINPNMTYYDYTEAESIYMELTGNCFLALENPSPNTKLPREIWPIRPDLVRIHPDKETGEVLGYTVHLGEGQKPLLYTRDEMLHRKYFNPTNWFWGASPLQAYKAGLTFEYYTKQYENNFFKHGVRETGILTSGGALNDKQFERLKKQVEARYGGIEMMHRPMVLEGGLDWKRISVPPKDMEYKELKRWNKDEAEAIYNIPPLKMMDMEAASKLANAEIQERLFWSDTIIPRLKKREGFYEEWLFPFFFKKSELFNYRLRHDLGEVKSLQVSEKDKAELAVKLTSGINPILSVDEARERFYSFGPAPWGGKEPLVPINLMPASFVNTGGALTGGTQAERERFFDVLAEKIVKKIKDNGERKLIEGEVLEVIKEEEDDAVVDKYSEDYIWSIQPEFEVSEEQQLYWREWAVKRLKEEDRFVRSLNVEFRRELNETLNNLNKLNEGQLIPVKSLLFDESHAINNMRDTYLSNFGFIFRNVSSEEMSKWGLTNPVDYDSPTVLEYGRNQASWFAGTGRENLQIDQYPGVTGTQLEKLENTLNEGYRLGEGIPELTKRTQNVFAGTIRSTGYAARRIARTETIRLANFSRLTQYQRNKHIVKQKQWLAQLDARTEEICAGLHGEVVDLNASFSGGYYQPPDPHCFINSQVPIYTSKGWVSIGKVKIGDLVLTHKGRFRKVIDTPQHKGRKGAEIVKLYFKNYVYQNKVAKKKITVTIKHPILIAGKGWIVAKEIKVEDKILFLADKRCICGQYLPFEAKFEYCSSKCSIKGNKNKISGTLKKYYSNLINRDKRSLEMKLYLSVPENLEKMKKGVQDFWSNNLKREEVRKGIRNKVKLNYRNGVVDKYKITEKANEKTRQLYAEGKDLGFKNKERLAKAQQSLGRRAYGKTWLEERMGWYLNEVLNLKTESQYRVKGLFYDNFTKYNPVGRRRYYFIDFAFPKEKIAIECDGKYYHQDKKSDRRKDAFLRFKGWTILRFPEDRIKDDIESCGKEIQRVLNNHREKYIFGTSEIERIELVKHKGFHRLYNLTVEEDDSYIAKGLVVHNSNCRCAILPVIREKIEEILEEPKYLRDFPSLSEVKDNLKVEDYGTEIVNLHLSKLTVIPKQTLKNIIDYGYNFRIGNRVVTGWPEMEYLKGVQPRGWPEKYTWDMIPGAQSPSKKLIIAGSGEFSDKTKLLLHETGHAWNHVQAKLEGLEDTLSQTQEFTELHKKRFNKLSYYFQQEGPGGYAGAEETFAEAFAVLLGSGKKQAIKEFGQKIIEYINRRL